MPSFAALTPVPADPILGLTELFVADPRPEKVSLASGVYVDETGRTPILEVVREAESGFLVPPRDPDALGQAMLRLMEQTPEHRREMGERGREHVRVHYGLGRVVERWQDLYRQVSVRKGLNLAPTLLR